MNQQTAPPIVETLVVHRDVVYRNVLFKVKDPSLAEDITQDTFFKAIESLQKKPDYCETGQERSWLLIISANLCMDHFRLTKRRKTIPLTSHIPKSVDEGKAKEMLRKEKIDEVHTLIEQLPPEQREVVIFRYFYGFKFKEISHLTKTNVNTCLGRMRYALERMRSLMALQEA